MAVAVEEGVKSISGNLGGQLLKRGKMIEFSVIMGGWIFFVSHPPHIKKDQAPLL